MEEVYGTTPQGNQKNNLQDDPSFKKAKDLIEIRLFMKSTYYKAIE